jgi:hypothetical protein
MRMALWMLNQFRNVRYLRKLEMSFFEMSEAIKRIHSKWIVVVPDMGSKE